MRLHRLLPFLLATHIFVWTFAAVAGEDTADAASPDTQPSSTSAQQSTETWGDWTKVCGEDDTGREVCRIVQSVNQRESGQLIFQTTIGYFQDNPQPLMFLTAPLGIFLPRGLTLVIDGNEVKTVPVQRCDQNGCLAGVPMDPELIDLLQNGESGELVFATNVKQNAKVPLSLNGFTEAFSKLERPALPKSQSE